MRFFLVMRLCIAYTTRGLHDCQTLLYAHVGSVVLVGVTCLRLAVTMLQLLGRCRWFAPVIANVETHNSAAMNARQTG
jgi:hypothetical protein